MHAWQPCKRREFIRRIRQLGFQGPFQGTRHQFMIYEQHRLAIPSNAEFSVPQLRFMMREIEGVLERQVSSSEWNSL